MHSEKCYSSVFGMQYETLTTLPIVHDGTAHFFANDTVALAKWLSVEPTKCYYDPNDPITFVYSIGLSDWVIVDLVLTIVPMYINFIGLTYMYMTQKPSSLVMVWFGIIPLCVLLTIGLIFNIGECLVIGGVLFGTSLVFTVLYDAFYDDEDESSVVSSLV